MLGLLAFIARSALASPVLTAIVTTRFTRAARLAALGLLLMIFLRSILLVSRAATATRTGARRATGATGLRIALMLTLFLLAIMIVAFMLRMMALGDFLTSFGLGVILLLVMSMTMPVSIFPRVRLGTRTIRVRA